MKGTVYFVINEGEVVYASNSNIAVENYAENKEADAIEDEARDRDIDMDDLDDDDIAELGFMAGYNGGCYTTDSVKIPDEYDLDDSFDDLEGCTHTFGDLEEVYEYFDDPEIIY